MIVNGLAGQVMAACFQYSEVIDFVSHVGCIEMSDSQLLETMPNKANIENFASLPDWRSEVKIFHPFGQ